MRRLPIVLASAAGAAAIASTVLRNRSVKPRPFLDAAGTIIPGSISEKARIELNGVSQGMILKGKNVRNPVLLFLHGGPGLPEYFLEQQHPTGLDQLFTVCWWEQRGSGLSYSRRTPEASITQDQLVADTIAVTEYLRARFDCDRVYLMAHSAGTALGMRVVARAPELFHAYIAVAQITRQMESERLAYSYVVDQARSSGDKRLLKALARVRFEAAAELPPAWRSVRDSAMHRMGVGTMHDMHSVARGVMLASLMNREYSAVEKLNLWRGKLSRPSARMFTKILASDIPAEIRSIDIPVYFFHGRHDYTVSYALARQYFDELRAPQKAFYTFPASAHSPIFEEPSRSREILENDVLQGSTAMAD